MEHDDWDDLDGMEIEDLLELLEDPDFLHEQIMMLQQFLTEHGHTREDYAAWKANYHKRDLH